MKLIQLFNKLKSWHKLLILSFMLSFLLWISFFFFSCVNCSESFNYSDLIDFLISIPLNTIFYFVLFILIFKLLRIDFNTFFRINRFKIYFFIFFLILFFLKCIQYNLPDNILIRSIHMVLWYSRAIMEWITCFLVNGLSEFIGPFFCSYNPFNTITDWTFCSKDIIYYILLLFWIYFIGGLFQSIYIQMRVLFNNVKKRLLR